MSYQDAIAEMERGAWFQSRPLAIQAAALKRPPFLTYLHSASGQLCRIESYAEDLNGICRTALVEWFERPATNLQGLTQLTPSGRKELVAFETLVPVEPRT